jgi:8-oxo-dGTP pyrophosphatase MutT (NUDIX family)
MRRKPRILKVEKDFSVSWFEQIKKTILLPGNSRCEVFYSIKPTDYVTILAQTKGGKLLIVKQYRPAVEDYIFELPGGHIEKGEKPDQAIIRELKEETNCKAEEVILLGELNPDTGRLENSLWAFFAKDVEVGQFPDPDKNGGIEVYLVSPEVLINMVNEGKFNHALDLSVIALAITQQCLRI